MGYCIRKQFTEIQAFLKKEEKSQTDYFTHHLNELEKEEQTKPKVSRRKEIIKIKEKINKIEIKKTIEEINFFLTSYYERYKGLYLKSKKFIEKLSKVGEKNE